MTRRDENYSAAAVAPDTSGKRVCVCGGGGILRTLRVFPSKCLHNVFQKIYFGPGPGKTLWRRVVKRLWPLLECFSFFPSFFFSFFLRDRTSRAGGTDGNEKKTNGFLGFSFFSLPSPPPTTRLALFFWPRRRVLIKNRQRRRRVGVLSYDFIF